MISGRNYYFFISFHTLNKKYLRYTFVQIITIFPRTIHTNSQLVIVLSTVFSSLKTRNSNDFPLISIRNSAESEC